MNNLKHSPATPNERPAPTDDGRSVNDPAYQLEMLQRAELHTRSACFERNLIDGSGYWSPGVYRLLGIDNVDTVPTFEKVLDLIHPEYREQVRRNFEDTALAGIERSHEFLIDLPNEEPRRLWCHLRPIHSNDRVVGVFGTLLDVTDYHQYKEEADQVARRLAEHLDNAPYAIIEWSTDAKIRQWTGTAERIFGWSSEEAVGTTFAALELVHEGDLPKVNEILPKLFSGEIDSVVSVNRNVRKDGQVIWCHWHNSILGASGGNERSTLSIVLDITEHIETRTALEERQQELLEAQKLAEIGSWRWVDGRQGMRWSSGMYRLWRTDPQTSKNSINQIFETVHEDDRNGLRQLVSDAIESRTGYQTEFRITRSDGQERHIAASGKTVVDDDGQLSMLGICQDITDRKVAENELRHLAYHDSLTGLPNRARFMSVLTEHLQESGGTATLLLLDLDHFKEVNDTLGHNAGDELLIEVSRRLRQCLRPEDFAARLGGDEFAILVPSDMRNQTDERLAGRLLETLALPIEICGATVQVSGTIGISTAPRDGSTAAELLSHADLALYDAKDLGRAGFRHYAPQLATKAQAKLKGVDELRAALKNDELDVHYQPQIDVRRGVVGGFEALMRWPHPERGFVPPAEFIPLAESTSLISELGTWILRRACQDAVDLFVGEMAHCHLSVNVSPAQIWQCDLPSIAAAILEDTGLHPSRLVLELTESIFVDQDRYDVKNFLDGIDRLGIRLALDDFGCGYSSLGYLHDLPFDILKIDRHFVMDCESSIEKRKLLTGIVSLGHGLGLEVVAEGAETMEQVRILKDINCDHIQGYYFGRPGPIADFAGINTVARSHSKPKLSHAIDAC